jgi:hypothetical protein
LKRDQKNPGRPSAQAASLHDANYRMLTFFHFWFPFSTAQLSIMHAIQVTEKISLVFFRLIFTMASAL